MQHNSAYAFRYIPGLIDRTRETWAQFQFQSGNPCPIEDVHFIPALGGCFVVVDEKAHKLLPSRSPEGMLDQYWRWIEEHRPILPRSGMLMVVDDDESILKLLKIVLESSGYQVRALSNARTALEALEEEEHPDVIVVDLKMPGMDGRQFIEQVKSKEIDSRIIIASAYEARDAADELRADGALNKPFLPDDLINLIQRLTAVPA